MQVGRVKVKGLAAGSARGFSLIELLVVVVVLAILGAITFPVFVKAKETAKISECLSNMRQIGTGLRMYIDDYGDRFPAAVAFGSADYWDGRRQTFQALLQPYVGSGMVSEKRDGKTVYVSVGVFRCPSDNGPTREDKCIFGVRKGIPVWKCTGSSYEYCASVQEDWEHSNVAVPWTSLSPLLASAGDKARVGAPFKAIVYPTKKAVVSDLCYWHLGDQTPDNCVVYANTLFADGHASRVRGADHLDARLQQLNRWHASTEISYEK